MEDCNRFVDYIVAEGLAQRNPKLKIQIANSHKQFRSRLNSAGARDRPPPTGASKPRTMRRIMEENETNSDALATPSGDDAEDDSSTGYQQNSIRATALDASDFEDCFEHPTIHSVTITVAEEDPALPSSETVHLDTMSDPIHLRRLAATYDQPRHLLFAHADNGSINAFDVPFVSTASTPFTWVHTPDAERKNFDSKKKKSQGDLRVVTVLMQSVGDLQDKKDRVAHINDRVAYPAWMRKKIGTDPVRCPIWDLSEGCSSRLHTCPILIVFRLGWGRRIIIERVGPAEKVGRQPPKLVIPLRKRSCDLHDRKCFDWAPKTKYLQV